MIKYLEFVDGLRPKPSGVSVKRYDGAGTARIGIARMYGGKMRAGTSLNPAGLRELAGRLVEVADQIEADAAEYKARRAEIL